MRMHDTRPNQSRILSCSHPDYLAYSCDFSELWVGAKDINLARSHNWLGGFKGRPELAESIWKPIIAQSAGRKPRALVDTLNSLRRFFRFLDAYESQGFQQVEHLEDLRSEHSMLWQNPMSDAWQPPNQKRAYNQVGSLLQEARRELLGRNDIFDWHPFPKREPTESKDLPSEPEIREALSLLKETARRIFARWSHADALAKTGRNILDVHRKIGVKGAFDERVNEADIHATYRELIKRTGDPLPSIYLLKEALGLSKVSNCVPTWWPRHPNDHPRGGEKLLLDEIIEGLYPTYADVDSLLLLFVARTGWNVSTALAIDVSDPNWSYPHGDPESDLWRIESRKERGNSWQWTLSQGKNMTGAYQVISKLVERTKPLRDLAERQPERAPNRAITLRSPWIVAGTSFRSYHVLVRNTEHSSAAATHWKSMIRCHNDIVAPPRPRIPESMTPSDWRDIYADFVFRDSRYSWVLVQWALGHRHMRTTRHYLRSRLWRSHSESKLSHLVTVMIDGIEVNARVDATLIRAKIEFNFAPDPVRLETLENHRREVAQSDLSYTGHACTSPFTPPPEIDPGNPADGTERCKRGDRCTSCPLALAVDSIHMSKRVAELMWLQRNVNEVIWRESHYACDLDSLQAELKQWPPEEVASHIRSWQEKIEDGRHRVLRFGARQ